MDASKLRPLGIGEILDAAINIYRSRFGQMVLAVALLVIPTQVLAAVVALSADESDELTTAGGYVANFLINLLSIAAASLATAASMKIVSSAYLGQESDWRSSLRMAFSKSGPLLGATVLLILIAAAAGFGVVLAGFLAGPAGVIPLLLVLVPLGIYFAVSISVFVPALMVEDTGAWGSLKRSRELIRGRWWPVLACLFVSFLLANIVTGVIQGVFAAGSLAADNYILSVLVFAIGGTIASCITTPFLAAAVSMIYFDLRVRKEGFDLELLARTLGTDPPPPQPPTTFPGQDPGPLPRPPSF